MREKVWHGCTTTATQEDYLALKVSHGNISISLFLSLKHTASFLFIRCLWDTNWPTRFSALYFWRSYKRCRKIGKKNSDLSKADDIEGNI